MKSFLSTLTILNLFIGITCFGETGFLNNGVTAHRGNSSEHPENTIPAFKSGIELGCDWLELDVYATKDGQLLVVHDVDTARVSGKNLKIAETLYDDLKTIDVAHDFRVRNKLTLQECPSQYMPLLSDVLRLVMQQNKTRMSIQPKNNCVKAAVMLIRKLKAEKWVGFNDGSLPKMKQVKQLEKSIPVFWDRPANSKIEDDINIALKEGFESLVINQNGITLDKINKVHEAQLEMGVWTVNNPVKLKKFLGMGVDRIYTDSPRTLFKLKQ